MAKYPTSDYSERVAGYLKAVGEASTKSIMEDITGTHFRLVEGLVLLLRDKKVKVRSDGDYLMWSLNARMETK